MTYSQIKELFNKYNALYFNNELTCSIELSSTGRVTRRYGDFSPRRNRIRIFSKMHRKSSDAMWKGTIIHEMTHAILCKRFGARNCGHTPRFHSILGPIMSQEFGIRYTRNRFVQTSLEKVTGIKVNKHPENDADRFKIVSSGEIGTFLKESVIYGKKHVTLQVQGKLFPFTVDVSKVERIAA